MESDRREAERHLLQISDRWRVLIEVWHKTENEISILFMLFVLVKVLDGTKVEGDHAEDSKVCPPSMLSFFLRSRRNFAPQVRDWIKTFFIV